MDANKITALILLLMASTGYGAPKTHAQPKPSPTAEPTAAPTPSPTPSPTPYVSQQLTVISAPTRTIDTDTSNMVMPGDTLYILLIGPTRITGTISVNDDGKVDIPILKHGQLILGYLTIPEAISHIKGTLLQENAGEYVVNIKKLK